MTLAIQRLASQQQHPCRRHSTDRDLIFWSEHDKLVLAECVAANLHLTAGDIGRAFRVVGGNGMADAGCIAASA